MTGPSRRARAFVVAACSLAAACGGTSPSDARPVDDTARVVATSVTDSAAPPGAGDGSGLGVFESLVGVGAVVEATVVGFRGPRIVMTPRGVDYLGASDDDADWATPVGSPVIIIDDVELIRSISGSERADDVAAGVEQAVADGVAIDVLAPVGVYDEGGRYELWLSRWSDPDPAVRHMTYLAFGGDGHVLDGLFEPGAGEAIERLMRQTGTDRVTSLAALATEMTAAWDGAGQGELMDVVYGPEAVSSEEDATAEAIASGQGVQIDVGLIGAEPDVLYWLEGVAPAGWATTNADGHNGVTGWATSGAVLRLVQLLPSQERDLDDRGEPVAGAPLLTVTDGDDPLRAVYDLDDDGRITLRADLSLAERNTLLRDDLGLPPETDG